jgi:hypothetical protein
MIANSVMVDGPQSSGGARKLETAAAENPEIESDGSKFRIPRL